MTHRNIPFVFDRRPETVVFTIPLYFPALLALAPVALAVRSVGRAGADDHGGALRICLEVPSSISAVCGQVARGRLRGCVRACVGVWVGACVRASVHACVRGRAGACVPKRAPEAWARIPVEDLSAAAASGA
jgi:hypothetical protein